MTVGFVMMLYGDRIPNPAEQVLAMVADCKANRTTLFLSRRVISTTAYTPGRSIVGFLSDTNGGRCLTAYALLQGVYPLPRAGLPTGITMRNVLPIYRDCLERSRNQFECFVKLSQVRRLQPGVGLADLNWRTKEGNSTRIPKYQGGSYFKVIQPTIIVRKSS